MPVLTTENFFVNIPVTPTEYVGASHGGKLGGVTKTRNGKRNGMENGMKRKFRMKTKYMNFVDTTTHKGKRFEIKQNFDF